MNTIACVYIEDFGLPSGDIPSALVDYQQRRARIAAASASARAAGVKPCLSLTRARALCPNLTPQPLKQERVDALRDRLLEKLWTFTNKIEIDADAMPQSAILWLDLGRNKDADAQRLGERIRESVSRIGLAGSVGIARGKFTALAAARHANCGFQFVRHGEDAVFLAQLPIALLAAEKEDARRLDLMGICTLGQFAALSRSSIAAQFGKRGRMWHLLATGQDSRPLRAFKMPDFEREGFDFDDGVTTRVILDDTLARFASTMAQRLDTRRSGAHDLALTVYFERGATRVERVQRVQPFTDAADLRRALYALLNKAAPDSVVTGLSLTLGRFSAVEPRQLDLFDQRPRGQATLDLAAELTKRYGPHFFTAELTGASQLPERRFRLLPLKRENVS